MTLQLPDWNDLAACGDDRWTLLPAVLRVAADEYPDLDPSSCADRLDALADAIRPSLAGIASLPLQMATINHHLFHRAGFAGASDDYYAADNNHLNRVLETRRGNPIALSIVQIEVAARLGLTVHGVSFPGHFLTRLDQGDDMVLVMDPYHGGRPLGLDQLEKLAAHHLGGQAPGTLLLQRLLMPATGRAIVLRLLRNLQRTWTSQNLWDRVARCADRQLLLAPEMDDALRDRGLAYLQMGHHVAARQDLEAYLLRVPDADEQRLVRHLLGEIALQRGQLH